MGEINRIWHGQSSYVAGYYNKVSETGVRQNAETCFRVRETIIGSLVQPEGSESGYRKFLLVIVTF